MQSDDRRRRFSPNPQEGVAPLRPHGRAYAHNDLGVVQQLTGDFPAAASHQRALAMFSDLGNLLGQAEAHNNLGQLAIRAANTPQARTHHAQALAIARDISAPLEEARALEGLGQTHLQDGSHDKGLGLLHQAQTIYQRIGAPAARRVQETLQNHRLTSTPELQPQTPSSKGHESHVWRTPIDPRDG